MVNDTETIVICNFRYDKETRRDFYIPTRISGVTVYYSAGVSVSGGQSGTGRSKDDSYKIRIPLSAEIEGNRKFVRSADYVNLSDEDLQNYWTIQSNCYVILGDVKDESALKDDSAVRNCGNDFFEVTDYSDNTRRGSDAVKHWRIGGS